MSATSGRPPSGDAAGLLWLVRHLQRGDFAQTFRRGLSDAELLGVIAALPPERRDSLLDVPATAACHRQRPAGGRRWSADQTVPWRWRCARGVSGPACRRGNWPPCLVSSSPR